jgi:uncharacterized protein YidB (DUF937 family)
MTALLGLLAVAGYQNREKISEMLSNKTDSGGQPGGKGLSGLLGGGSGKGSGIEGMLGGFLGGSGIDKLLGGGLSELTDRFRQNGHAETAESWVGQGTNRDVSPKDLEQVLDEDTLTELTEKTGLSRTELLSRLSRELPRAVDQYTPDGRIPYQTT